MPKSLVTGGLGFIGSHLVEQLLNQGHDVVVVDNEATGQRSNLKNVANNPKLAIVNHDVREPFAKADWQKNISAVFHLAALADIVPSIEQPERYFHTNATGTMNVMELAKTIGVKKVVYAASSSCYGIPDVYPTPETAPAKPEYPYALTKYLGEQIVLHWGKIYRIPTVSLRFFNVFGPRSRTTGAYGAVFGVFLAQKLAKKPLTIVGDGTQTRDFTYVSDVVDAVITAAESKIENDIFNVGSGKTVSVNHLADLLGGERVTIPKRPGEPDCTFADISKIKKILNWSPKVNFEQGVSQMLSRIEDWSNAPVWTPAAIENATEKWFRYLSR